MIHLTAVEIDVTLLNVRRLFEFLLRKQIILRYKELFFLECDFFFRRKCSTRLQKNRHFHRAKTQKSVNLNMAETRDSVAETRRLPFVSVSGYIYLRFFMFPSQRSQPNRRTF